MARAKKTDATITDDMQLRRGGDRRRSVDVRRALETLRMLICVSDERRRRQTADDVEPAETSSSRHRHFAAQHKLHAHTHLYSVGGRR